MKYDNGISSVFIPICKNKSIVKEIVVKYVKFAKFNTKSLFEI